MPSIEWYHSIHERLLASDPTAPAELAQNVLGTLIKRLSQKYFYLNDSDLIFDAVTDALMSYIKNPNQFDASKRGLPGYLHMAAEGDLKNALSKAKRIQEKEILSEDVELMVTGGNTYREPALEEVLERREMADDLHSLLSTLFADPVDLRMANLILQGERSTQKFAELLGMQRLPVPECRRAVKREKDRVKKRMERYLKRQA